MFGNFMSLKIRYNSWFKVHTPLPNKKPSILIVERSMYYIFQILKAINGTLCEF